MAQLPKLVAQLHLPKLCSLVAQLHSLVAQLHSLAALLHSLMAGLQRQPQAHAHAKQRP